MLFGVIYVAICYGGCYMERPGAFYLSSTVIYISLLVYLFKAEKINPVDENVVGKTVRSPLLS